VLVVLREALQGVQARPRQAVQAQESVPGRFPVAAAPLAARGEEIVVRRAHRPAESVSAQNIRRLPARRLETVVPVIA
jgi:hypothetical protein